MIEGTSQQISVNTTPAGAQCTFLRNGETLGSIAATPGALTVKKTRDDLVIVCSKRGYASATYLNRSGLAMVAYANILTAGLTWAVDTSLGADNKYQGEVEMALAPLGPAVPGEPRPFAPDQPPAPPPPGPQARGGTPAPPPVPIPTAVPPAGPQLNCTAPDGSSIRVTGTACPGGWAVAR